MIYIIFFVLAIIIFFVFRSTTSSYHSWDIIKERWFQVGLDNAMLFSSGTPQRGKELIRLDGQHNTYTVALSLVKDSRSQVLVEVFYPEELKTHLINYPSGTFTSINKILSGEIKSLDDSLEPIAQEINNRSLKKRLHPQVIEQLILLQKEYGRLGRKFELTSEKLKYNQDGLLHDPTMLFPVLDEMAVTVRLLNEHAEHLLVQ
ncbi:MAG: hypothetical protein HY819_14625 [Acidobacteria bacterium]|nr:hypothetical protein [Acidobacteriota bacterium]